MGGEARLPPCVSWQSKKSIAKKRTRPHFTKSAVALRQKLEIAGTEHMISTAVGEITRIESES
jgi:hypothetical protein